MLSILGKLYFVAFMLNIVAHFVPTLKEQKWMDFIKLITHPVYSVFAELIPVKKDLLPILANLASGFSILLLVRILYFIL